MTSNGESTLGGTPRKQTARSSPGRATLFASQSLKNQKKIKKTFFVAKKIEKNTNEQLPFQVHHLVSFSVHFLDQQEIDE